MVGPHSSIRWIPIGLISTVAALLLIASAVPVAAQVVKSSANGRHCLLLKNDNVLFGNAYQLGEFVIVRTGPSDEIRLPRSDVACWAKSLADLYQYRVDHRSDKSLESHLKEARWCMQYELFKQAEAEIRAAKAISPNHRSVVLLDGQLKRRRERTKHSAAPIVSVSTANFVQAVNPRDVGRRDANQRDIGEANRVDPMTLRGFASHVQPTLINRCGRCHDQDSELDWRLTVPPSGSRATSRITRVNLAASLRFVDRGNPEQSILLIKATSPHGGTDAPLSGRNAKAIHAFKRWLIYTSNSAPQPPLGRVERDRNPNQPALTSTALTSTAPSAASLSIVAQASFTSEGSAVPTSPVGSPIDSDHPQRLPTVNNPFDPSLFNRRFHRRDE